MRSQLDHLDTIAARLFSTARHPNTRRDAFGVLSTGEKLYVALAANRPDLLASMDYTIAEAIHRIDEPWARELAQRWQYGVPELAALTVDSEAGQ